MSYFMLDMFYYYTYRKMESNCPSLSVFRKVIFGGFKCNGPSWLPSQDPNVVYGEKDFTHHCLWAFDGKDE